MDTIVDRVAKKFKVAPAVLAEAIIIEHMDKNVRPKTKKVKVDIDIPMREANRLRKIAKALFISLNSLIVGITIFEAKKVIFQAKLKKQYAKFEQDLFKSQCKAMEKEMAKEDKKSIKSK